jgi:hypothetical protein
MWFSAISAQGATRNHLLYKMPAISASQAISLLRGYQRVLHVPWENIQTWMLSYA